MTRIVILFTLVFCYSSIAYQLTLIHDVSRSKQTFVTRNGKAQGIFEGKESTFTADNVSIIAKAKTVTRDFTQWEILNDFTDIPFRKGQTVTFYDATEYLWTLTPEKVKSKYIRKHVFKPRTSLNISSSFVRGLSESVSGTQNSDTTRGGLLLETFLERMMEKTYSLSLGIRYTRENINISNASLETQRLLGIVEAKYYFSAIEQLGGSKISLALGLGFGQSTTSAFNTRSSGSATLLPSTKVTLNYPMNDTTDFLVEAAYESLSIKEEFQSGNEQTTTLDNMKFGLGIKRYL